MLLIIHNKPGILCNELDIAWIFLTHTRFNYTRIWRRFPHRKGLLPDPRLGIDFTQTPVFFFFLSERTFIMQGRKVKMSATWKRFRLVILKGHSQPVELPASCAVCSRFRAFASCHQCWDEFWWFSCLWVISAIIIHPSHITVSNFNKLVIDGIVLWLLVGFLSGMSRHVLFLFGRSFIAQLKVTMGMGCCITYVFCISE